jgi:hypothetical protein
VRPVGPSHQDAVLTSPLLGSVTHHVDDDTMGGAAIVVSEAVGNLRRSAEERAAKAAGRAGETC